jgi:hypothetical protein
MALDYQTGKENGKEYLSSCDEVLVKFLCSVIRRTPSGSRAAAGIESFQMFKNSLGSGFYRSDEFHKFIKNGFELDLPEIFWYGEGKN